MLFLYRPPQTRIPIRYPQPVVQQSAYNQRMQASFEATRQASPAPASVDRVELLTRALHAMIGGDGAALRQLCTDDVKVWTPAVSTATRQALVTEIERRDEAFSDVSADVSPVPVSADVACAEWSITLTHSGSLSLPDGTSVEPTGLSVAIRGVSVAEFRGDRICALRQYWDELSLHEQLGLVPAPDQPADVSAG
jgi:ketosteroid isomerase-like protein